MIKIRHARPDEKKKIYEWLCLSDTTSMHSGPPDYPDIPIPDWETFQNDFEDFYFQESGQNKGSVIIIENDRKEIGCVCYACFHLNNNKAELDIWMKARQYCGKGFGPVALQKVIEYLQKEKGIQKFLIRPSEKNNRAIKAYEKAGLHRALNKKETIEKYLLPEYLDQHGNGDYGFENTAVLIRE